MNEPEDGTIVGWGTPIRGICVRIDEWSDREDDPRNRWFPGDEDNPAFPCTWDALLAHIKACGYEPYILEVKK